MNVCLSQRLGLDLIFDTEHVVFECKSILIVPPSDRVKRNLQGICMYACVSERAGLETHTKRYRELFRCIILLTNSLALGFFLSKSNMKIFSQNKYIRLSVKGCRSESFLSRLQQLYLCGGKKLGMYERTVYILCITVHLCASENVCRIIIFPAYMWRIMFKSKHAKQVDRQTDKQIDGRIKAVLLQYGNARLSSLPIRAVTSEMP